MEDIGYTNVTFDIWSDFSSLFGVGFIQTQIRSLEGDVSLTTSLTGDFVLKILLVSSEDENYILEKYNFLDRSFTIGDLTYDDESIYITYPISKLGFRSNILLARNEVMGLRKLIESETGKEKREHPDLAKIQQFIDGEL